MTNYTKLSLNNYFNDKSVVEIIDSFDGDEKLYKIEIVVWNMTEIEKQQIDRIKNKLPLIKAKDPELKIFGANKHKYQWNKPATEEEIVAVEKKRGIEIPQSLRLFIKHVSNGAPGFAYGIFSIEKMYAEGDPTAPCQVYPYMTQEEFDKMTEEDEDIDSMLVYNGMLSIATEGCTYDINIVLNGPYKGRLVRTDSNLFRPFEFIHDSDFLSWYERWLDGLLNGMIPEAFACSVPGTVDELINMFYETDIDDLQHDLVISIHRFPDSNLHPEVMKLYKLIAETETYPFPIKRSVLRFIAETEPDYMYNAVEKLLQSSNPGDFKTGIQLVYYTKLQSKHYETVRRLFNTINFGEDLDLFRAVCNIMTDKREYEGNLFEPFLEYPYTHIRSSAIYYVSKAVDYEKYIDTLISFFDDEDVNIVRNAVQAAERAGMKKLEVHYQKLWNRFPAETNDEHLIHSNLKNQLRRAGYPENYFEK